MLNREQTVSLLNFSLILVITLGVAFVLYTEVNKQKVIDRIQIIKEEGIPAQPQTLSEEEIQVERFQIIKMTPEGGETFNFEPGTVASELSPEQIPQDSQVVGTQDDYSSSGLVAVPINITDETALGEPTQADLETYVLPGSGIEVVGASVSYSTDQEVEGANTNVSFEGTIFSINDTLNIISVLQDSGSMISVKVPNGTQVTINSKLILFSNLRIGDIVNISGQRQNYSTDVIANLVDVVGSYQIIP